MLTVSCLCGVVRYEIDGPVTDIVHCHCHTCRKAHGTLYGSSAIVKRADFKLTEGAEALIGYESSPGKQRRFCRHCGAHIFAELDKDPNRLILRVGSLDGDPGVRPVRHIWVSDKAPWYEIHDDLPQHAEYPNRPE